MAKIPVVSGSERAVTPAVLGAAERSTQGEAAVAQGRMALAQGIQDVGRTAGNVALFQARLKNRADELRIEQTLHREEVDFQAFLESEPDETKWLDAANQRTSQVRKAVMSMPLAPAVKREAEQRLESWASAREVGVRTQAQRYAMKRHDSVLVAQIQMAADQGDKESIDALMDERIVLGTVHKDVANVARAEAYERADVAEAARLMNDDPQAAIAQLEEKTEGGRWRHFKDMGETARLSALRSAKNALETRRAETAQSIAEEIFTGKVAGLDTRLEQEVKSGNLTAETASNLRSFARGQRTPEEMASQGAQLWQAALDLKQSDPDYIQKASQLRASLHGLSPEVKDPVLDVLNQRDKGDVSEDVRNVYGQLNREFRANTFGNAQTFTAAEAEKENKRREKAASRVFGKDKPWTPVLEGDPKDRASFEQASATLFRYQKAMRAWLQAHPNATVAQIQEYRDTLTATDRAAERGGELLDAISMAVAD